MAAMQYSDAVFTQIMGDENKANRSMMIENKVGAGLCSPAVPGVPPRPFPGLAIFLPNQCMYLVLLSDSLLQEKACVPGAGR